MGILLFNWLGYRLVFNVLQYRAEVEVQSTIELNAYKDADLIEMRVDMRLPYYNNWKDYEPYYGEVEIDGKFYTFVKRKIEDGQLVLKCLPNFRKEKIRDRENHLFVVANGLDDDSSKPLPPLAKLAKSMLVDYDCNRQSYQFQALEVFEFKFFFAPEEELPFGYTTICEQPPDLQYM